MKFNQIMTATKKIQQAPSRVENYAGGVAFNPTDSLKLYLMCSTAMLEDKFYTSNENTLKEIQALCRKVPRKVLLFLAKYCRNELRLRSISHLLLAEASMRWDVRPDESKHDVIEYAPEIIQRVDDITETISYWITHLGKGKKSKLPNALKKGLGRAFNKFDEYALAKYNRDGAIKLSDALNLVHPKPKDAAQAELFKRVLDGKLATPETWEVEISGKGSTAENWNAIAPKMGIMALVRNLRNFEQKGADVALAHALEKLQDSETILNSKLLPFRFLSAEREVSHQATKDALRQALHLSIDNLPKLAGKTLYIVDNSGSMSSAIAGKSKVTCSDAACIMAAIGHRLSDESTVIVFGERAAIVPVSKLDSAITNSQRIGATDVGHSTYAFKALELAIAQNIQADRIILLSDMQCYGDRPIGASFFSQYQTHESTLQYQFDRYMKKVNKNCKLFSIDLQGYGNLQFLEDQRNVFPLGGFSERIIELIARLESAEPDFLPR